MIVAVCPQAEAALARLWVFLSPPELVELLTGLAGFRSAIWLVVSNLPNVGLVICNNGLHTAFTQHFHQPFSPSTLQPFQPFNPSTLQPFNPSTFQPFNPSILELRLAVVPSRLQYLVPELQAG